jgi:hypothetical protein
MEKKPYEARAKLKSIRYWQSVVSGEVPPKRPLAYYKNKLEFYPQEKINHLEKLASIWIFPQQK